MMKRNKELDYAYQSFIADIKLFVEETKYLVDEKTKKIEKGQKKLHKTIISGKIDEESEAPIVFSENPIPILQEKEELARIRKLAHNANFLYCFALFEYYAANVVKLTYKFGGQAENSPKKRYIHRFKEVGKKSSENRDHRYTDLFDSPQKMIEF